MNHLPFQCQYHYHNSDAQNSSYHNNCRLMQKKPQLLLLPQLPHLPPQYVSAPRAGTGLSSLLFQRTFFDLRLVWVKEKQNAPCNVHQPFISIEPTAYTGC